MMPSLDVRNRWVLPPALFALLVVLASACGGGGIASLDDAALSLDDVPADWVPADIEESKGQALWDTLPELLTVDSEARLILYAFEAESGLHGAATMFIETDDPAVLPMAMQSDEVLAPLSSLLVRQDALLIPSPRGGDPGAYFAASDLPLPGSLRSRLVRLQDDELLYSDSVTFTVGPVLAVVTVWYPEQEGPFGDVDEMAVAVERRVQSFLDQS